MALQMATNITPDAFSGVGGAVFDATAGLDVSWQVNGSPYLAAYQITLCKMDNASTQLYTTGKIVLEKPFYGVLANGEVQIFHAGTISAAALAQAGIANGNEYKMYITQWWGAQDAQSVTNQSAAAIQALSKPTVAIDAYPAPLNERMYTFSATYTQAEGDGIAWVRWVLYDRSNGDAVVTDTGEIYGTSQLLFTHDAFFTGTIYGLEVTVGTQAGQRAASGMKDIFISYAAGAPTGSLVAMQQCGWNGVNVNWESAKNMMGTAYGDYAYADDALELPVESEVAWEKEAREGIRFAPPYSVAWHGSVPSGVGPYPIASMSTENGEAYLTVRRSASQTTVQYEAGGTAASVVLESASAGELYALVNESALYATLKQTDGTMKQGSAQLSAAQSPITSIRIKGPQTCKLLWVEKGTVNGPIAPDAFLPEYTKDTYLMTAFENHDLNAGNSDTTGYSLYRRDNTTGEYQHVADLNVTQTGLIDYGARNGHSYTYQLWYTSNTIFTQIGRAHV